MKNFVLYGTESCHLCELAHAMIEEQRGPGADFACETVDISKSDALFECYGLRIPVLRHPNERELDWPFTPDQLNCFLTS